MKPIFVPLSKIHEYAKSTNLRIGQQIINDNDKPASEMDDNELQIRNNLFYVPNETFWKDPEKFGVEIGWNQ